MPICPECGARGLPVGGPAARWECPVCGMPLGDEATPAMTAGPPRAPGEAPREPAGVAQVLRALHLPPGVGEEARRILGRAGLGPEDGRDWEAAAVVAAAREAGHDAGDDAAAAAVGVDAAAVQRRREQLRGG